MAFKMKGWSAFTKKTDKNKPSPEHTDLYNQRPPFEHLLETETQTHGPKDLSYKNFERSSAHDKLKKTISKTKKNVSDYVKKKKANIDADPSMWDFAKKKKKKDSSFDFGLAGGFANYQNMRQQNQMEDMQGQIDTLNPGQSVGTQPSMMNKRKKNKKSK